jgi:hypothetical protein
LKLELGHVEINVCPFKIPENITLKEKHIRRE